MAAGKLTGHFVQMCLDLGSHCSHQICQEYTAAATVLTRSIHVEGLISGNFHSWDIPDTQYIPDTQNIPDTYTNVSCMAVVGGYRAISPICPWAQRGPAARALAASATLAIPGTRKQRNSTSNPFSNSRYRAGPSRTLLSERKSVRRTRIAPAISTPCCGA